LEKITYKNARIEVSPLGAGWKASVWFGDGMAWYEIPTTPDPAGKNEVIAQAKVIVDQNPDR
jgi:hypothetical protein